MTKMVKERTKHEEACPSMQRALSAEVIELTDSEEECHKWQMYNNIIDLTSSHSGSEDDEQDKLQEDIPSAIFSDDYQLGEQPKRFQSLANIPQDPIAPRKTPVTTVPLYLDEDIPGDDTGLDDGAILILNEPKKARKPLRIGTDICNPATPIKHLPVASKTIGTPKARISKSQAALEKETRMKYAQQLFDELNEAVFKNCLPKETQLNWNKRLLTTAGRAKWRKSKEGTQSTEIELSEKILDCNERIRNTLSHEMCHLAAWVIDGNPKEGHGKLWKNWAMKVMKKHPDIEISTRHNYEISYPYQWRCELCARIYGRFSKSIRAEECVCGACKEGRLVPLFSVRHGTRKRDEDGSDSTKQRILPASDNGINTESDSESEVGILLTTFKSITIL